MTLLSDKDAVAIWLAQASGFTAEQDTDRDFKRIWTVSYKGRKIPFGAYSSEHVALERVGRYLQEGRKICGKDF